MRISSALVILSAITIPAWAAPNFLPLDRPQARALVALDAHLVPTVVALWSSDCVHCKKNLGLFARMAQERLRFTLITVVTERPAPELATLLDNLAVPGKRYAYGDDAPEALAFALDPKWRGELPRTLFFDGRGNVTTVSGVVDRATAERLLGLKMLRSH